MATLSIILACRIPWTEVPGGLEPKGLQRVRHNLATKQQQNLRSPMWEKIDSQNVHLRIIKKLIATKQTAQKGEILIYP